MTQRRPGTTATVILATSLLLGLAACSNDNPEKPVTMIQPGESTQSIGSLQFDAESDAASDDEDTPEFCDYTIPGTTVAVFEGGSSPTPSDALDPCDYQYASAAWKGNLKVIGVASGQELPSTLPAVAVHHGWPEAGETWLASLRPLNGEWFITSRIRVNITSNSISSDTWTLEGFPTDFEELVAMSEAHRDDYPGQCPNHQILANRTDDEWGDIFLGPGFDCRQGEQPSNNDEQPSNNDSHNGDVTVTTGG